MPIYEYECGACGHQLEAFQKINESPLIKCPTCHKPALSKLISSTSFQLKGTGWYATDFRDKGKPKQNNDSTKLEAGTGGSPSEGQATTAQATEKKANDKSTE